VKLATFIHPVTGERRVGALQLAEGIEYLVDVAAAHALLLREGRDAGDAAVDQVPSDMIKLLEGGDATLLAARRGIELLGHRLAEGIVHRRDGVRLLAPIPRPPKIIAIGANYHDHVQEGRASGALDRPLPPYPPAFLKMASAVIGPDESIVYPRFGDELDYEVEFSIVIGKHCKYIAPEDWLDVIAGYTIVNDLSLRDVILEEKASGLVFVGKNFATSCPMGPFLVTKDELPNPDDLRLQLRVNGAVRQDGRTSSMIHNCATVVSYWSRLGLEPGDVITTGTPGGGAGFGRRHPERLLKVGDVIEAEIEGIGVLHNRVAAEPSASRIPVQAQPALHSAATN
jgi:acylpyruvate hydrolase